MTGTLLNRNDYHPHFKRADLIQSNETLNSSKMDSLKNGFNLVGKKLSSRKIKSGTEIEYGNAILSFTHSYSNSLMMMELSFPFGTQKSSKKKGANLQFRN